MNRTKTIALFAGIFAIAMTTYGLSGNFASPLVMASIPQAQEGVGMLGHVEYTVLDSDLNIKSYLQTDNVIVLGGLDCAAEYLFGTTNSGNCIDTGANKAFNFIGIGNGTGVSAAAGDEILDDDGSGVCGRGNTGEQARKSVTATQVDAPNAGTGTIVTIDVGTDVFNFDAGNATTITQSALFNNGTAGIDVSDGSCLELGSSGSNWEMFAIQDLSGGVTVTPGDSLAVKWTITLK